MSQYRDEWPQRNWSSTRHIWEKVICDKGGMLQLQNPYNLGQKSMSRSKWPKMVCATPPTLENPHTKFGITTSNNISNMLQTRLFQKLSHRSRLQWSKMVCDISPSKDASIHQIWDSFLNLYRRYAFDTIILDNMSPSPWPKNSKWVWSGNTTITNRRQPCGTARKSRSTITRHQEDNFSKATSSLFPIKMIAILERTQGNVQQNIEQLQTPTMGVTINKKSTTTEPPP